MIKLSNLTKLYGGHYALHDVSLQINKGEIFGIIGKSGAGKSTLLRCINLLERPDHGEVIVDDENINQLDARALSVARHKTAMIFQQFNLLHSKNVYDNIALPMRIQGFSLSKIDKKVHELLKLVELEDKIHAYPGQLSGGQKQRVAIARALTCAPKILLCDEATSALDPKTTDAILNLLKKINTIYGITIVLITHEMDVVKRICNRMAVMEKSKIIEVATMLEVLTRQDSLARQMLFANLSPILPACLTSRLSQVPNDKPLLKLLFEGVHATAPFISQTSRELHLDISILLANIDRIDAVTCGVLIIELTAPEKLLTKFLQSCTNAGLTVEILGYVTDDVF